MPSTDVTTPPYLMGEALRQRRLYIETYGCQMNFNDSEIVLGILTKSKEYQRVDSLEEADVALLMTCAIREGAESKIWNRLDYLRSLEKKQGRNLTIGILGCMAERLKAEVMERKKWVDVVCGPDAYRDLPRLLREAETGQPGINTILSYDETYADVAPVRLDPAKKSAYISIMRGCDNMCTYCIVPFTRGKERSRPWQTIVEEAKGLADQGVNEIVLLGQNVNSYRDASVGEDYFIGINDIQMSKGFKTVYKPKLGGFKFTNLLDAVSRAVPDVRLRFTSPHPKDFPDDLLHLMKERSNICKNIHLPVQSGSSPVLERMRRGYTREAYLELVHKIRDILPAVSLSSDFIVGFCGETENDHQATLDLVREVGYDMAFMFAYSMREKTLAHRRYSDDVPEDVKQTRLRQLIDLFYAEQIKRSTALIGTQHVIMVDGPSKRNPEEAAGRTDGNRMVVISGGCKYQPGDMVKVTITDVMGSTLIGEPIHTTNTTHN